MTVFQNQSAGRRRVAFGAPIPGKIVAIVESYKDPVGRPLGAPDENSVHIANHIIDFLQFEVKSGRLPENLLPLQSGVGSIANAVVGGILNSPFENLTVWTEVLQDNLLDLFDSLHEVLFAKAFQRFKPVGDQFFTQHIIPDRANNRVPQRVRILTRCKQPVLTIQHDLIHDRNIARHNRTAGRHRFKHRQAEPLIAGRKGQHRCRIIEPHLVRLVHPFQYL